MSAVLKEASAEQELPAVSAPTDTSLSEIADTLIETMPEVQPGAVQMERDRQKEIVSQPDDFGTLFDENIHAKNPDGTPRKTAKGAYAKKRGIGAKAGAAKSVAGSRLGDGIPKEPEKTPGQVAEAQARAAAVVATRCSLLLMLAVGGEEWQPTNKNPLLGEMDERQFLEAAVGDYFVTKQWADLPPGIALALAFGIYAVPRFHMKETRSRLQKLKNWIGAKITQYRARKAGIKVNVEPQQ